MELEGAQEQQNCLVVQRINFRDGQKSKNSLIYKT